MAKNQQVLLDNRPSGEAQVSNFKIVSSDTPALKDGQVLIKHHYLSLDPYMRMRMNDSKSYAAPQELGTVMIGGTVGEVVESKSPEYAVGDKVANFGGWQLYSVADASDKSLRKVDPEHVPLSYYLGAVGMPGITAWIGLLTICKPKKGETVVVSAASGAVGSVVGQLAKAHGCRVVGFAGGPEKCRYVEEELGFDACIDYKQHGSTDSLVAALREKAPDGVDCNFENVGGQILDAIMTCMNPFGRMAICGMISGYEKGAAPLAQPALILTQRLSLQGFIVGEHMQHWPAAIEELSGIAKSGKLKYRESIADGLEAAPEAFLGMLKGKNFGKQLVKLV